MLDNGTGFRGKPCQKPRRAANSIVGWRPVSEIDLQPVSKGFIDRKRVFQFSYYKNLIVGNHYSISTTVGLPLLFGPLCTGGFLFLKYENCCNNQSNQL